jgi:hypothetical protein
MSCIAQELEPALYGSHSGSPDPSRRGSGHVVSQPYQRYAIPSESAGIDDDFTDSEDDGWRPTGDTWTVESGAYNGQHDGRSASLWHLTLTSGLFATVNGGL